MGFLHASEGTPPSDAVPSVAELERRQAVAQAWVNAKGAEDALACLSAFEEAVGVRSEKNSEGQSRSETPKGGASRTSSVAVVGESHSVAPLIANAEMFRETEAMVALGRANVALGEVGQSKGSLAGKRSSDDKKLSGAVKYLGPWDRRHPDLQLMMNAARECDKVKLEIAVQDHMGRSSLKLNMLQPSQRLEYGAYKTMEARLGLVAEGMETLAAEYAEAALRNESVARFYQDKVVGTPGDPAYWETGAGAELVSHLRVQQLRLAVTRDDPPGTWEKMENKVSELPEMSALGVKEREEAKKQALKEVKAAPSQKKSAPARAGGSASTAKSGAGGSYSKFSRSPATGVARDIVCHACKGPGHCARDGVCEPGRKWIAAKKAAGTWRDSGR